MYAEVSSYLAASRKAVKLQRMFTALTHMYMYGCLVLQSDSKPTGSGLRSYQRHDLHLRISGGNYPQPDHKPRRMRPAFRASPSTCWTSAPRQICSASDEGCRKLEGPALPGELPSHTSVISSSHRAANHSVVTRDTSKNTLHGQHQDSVAFTTKQHCHGCEVKVHPGKHIALCHVCCCET